MKCGMARNHLTNQSQRERPGSSVAVRTTGCSWVGLAIGPGRMLGAAGVSPGAWAAPTAPTTIRTIAAVVDTAPTPSMVSARGRTNEGLTPTFTSAATPGEPAAFITTADQRPLVASHTTSWVPGPVADATQNPCSVGGAISSSPGCERYTGSRPSASSISSSCAVPAR